MSESGFDANMPLTRQGTSTNGMLTALDDDSKLVELPVNDILTRLPKLYVRYVALTAE